MAPAMASSVSSSRRFAQTRTKNPVPKAHSRGALRVRAYRDEERIEQIVGAGHEFLRTFMSGVQDGPPSINSLNSLVDPEIQVTNHPLSSKYKNKGMDALKQLTQELSRTSMMQGATNPPELILSAANDNEDVFFGLLQTSYPEGKVYQIIQLDMFIDDTARRVSGMLLRGQFTPVEAKRIRDIHYGKDTVTGAPKEFGADKPTPHLHPNPEFPLDHVMKMPPPECDLGRRMAVSKAWCVAHSSDNSGEELEAILAPEFRCWDAYGVLPSFAMLSGQEESGDAITVSKPTIVKALQEGKERYSIDCRQQYSAFSADSNVGFSHWVAHMKNTKTGKEFMMDGVEVEIYNKEGQLKDVWMFRDPLDTELEMLSKLKVVNAES